MYDILNSYFFRGHYRDCIWAERAQTDIFLVIISSVLYLHSIWIVFDIINNSCFFFRRNGFKKGIVLLKVLTQGKEVDLFESNLSLSNVCAFVLESWYSQGQADLSDG